MIDKDGCSKAFWKILASDKTAVIECTKLNMTAECKSGLAGISRYLNLLKYILIASIWLKVLVSIDHKNKVRARKKHN